MRYAYKASLVGSAHQFELTDEGLSWRIAGRSGVWDYADISAVKLSYRPVSMQQQRFRVDIDHAKGGRIAILSTTWQTATLVAPQGHLYRDFIVELHRRMQAAGSTARLVGGLGSKTYTAALAVLAWLAVAMVGLLVMALMTANWTGALFLLASPRCSPGRSAASSAATARGATASINCPTRCYPSRCPSRIAIKRNET